MGTCKGTRDWERPVLSRRPDVRAYANTARGGQPALEHLEPRVLLNGDVQTIAIGDVANGAIETPGVIDEWRFDVAAGQTVFIDFQSLAGGVIDVELQAPGAGTVFTDWGVGGAADAADHGPALLAEAGTYTLVVDGRGDDTATYQFQVWDVPVADMATIAIGEVANGAIETPGVIDEWRFDVAAGQTVFVDFQELAGGVIDVELQAPGAGTVFTDWGVGGAADAADHGPALLAEAGTYTLVVDGRGDDTATYQFQVWDVPVADMATIAIGEVANGAIETPGVIDEWRFDAAAGQTVFVDFQELTGGEVDIELQAPGGGTVFTDVAAWRDYLDNGPTPLTEAGTYTLVVDCQGDDTATYQFVLYDVPAPDVQAIALGDVANGEIETPGVVDEWQVDIAENQTVFLDVQLAAGGYLDFELQAPGGGTVFTDSTWSGGADYADHGPTLLTEAGTYTLVVDGRGDDTLPYQFVLYDVPAPDVQAIALGDVANGEIETPGVVDEWQVDVGEDQTIFLDVQQVAGGFLEFELQAPGGSQVFLATTYTGGTDAADTGPVILTDPGTYALVVDGRGDDTAIYQFQLWDVPDPDVSLISLDDYASGEIETPGVVDEWRFDATGGETVFFDVRYIERGSPVDNVTFELRRPDDSVLFTTSGRDGLDFADHEPVELPDAGTYTLMVDGRGDSTATYWFQLARVPEPDVTPILLAV